MSLCKEDALEVIKNLRSNRGPRYTYLFKCSDLHCSNKIKIRADALSTATGKCKKHTQVKRPFESIYNSLFNDHRNLEVDLSYEEYLEFTNIKNCNYCAGLIPWNPYSINEGTYISRAYFLDRKDSKKGYFKENCVVCCTLCNKVRSNLFSYDEFLLLAPILKTIRENREGVIFEEKEQECLNGVCGV